MFKMGFEYPIGVRAYPNSFNQYGGEEPAIKCVVIIPLNETIKTRVLRGNVSA